VRLANRVPGALLALALGAAGVFLIVEVAADRVDHRTALVNWRPAYTWAARNTWTAGSIRVTAAILILVGLVLLLVQLKPPRVSRLAADPARPARRAWIPPTRAGAWPPRCGQPSPA
jgi:hypothetical protein